MSIHLLMPPRAEHEVVGQEPVLVRRSAPTDRRTPYRIERGMCPARETCYCCPSAGEKGHGRTSGACKERHPAQARECSPPFPTVIPPCPERKVLPQDPPPGPRPPHYSCCIDCGRITARRWTRPDGTVSPWCNGEFPDQERQ
jgi:hypothetical protein